MLIDSVKMLDGDIDDGVIESGDALPDKATAKKGQVFYLSVADATHAVGLHVFDGTEWVGSAAATQAASSADESDIWMGA